MLKKAKLSLRISNDAFDDEVQNLIDSAKIDLKLAGVSDGSLGETVDAMVERAILTYCKAHFGMANPDSEKYKSIAKILKPAIPKGNKRKLT